MRLKLGLERMQLCLGKLSLQLHSIRVVSLSLGEEVYKARADVYQRVGHPFGSETREGDVVQRGVGLLPCGPMEARLKRGL